MPAPRFGAYLAPKTAGQGKTPITPNDKCEDIMERKTNKTERINLRVTPKLKEELEVSAMKEDLTLNEFCIQILKNKETTRALLAKTKAYKDTAKIFSKMGININQLARHCNYTKEAATPKQLIQVLDEAKLMQQEIIQQYLEKEGEINSSSNCKKQN